MSLNIPYSSFSLCALAILSLGPWSHQGLAQAQATQTAAQEQVPGHDIPLPGLPSAFQLPFQIPGAEGDLPAGFGSQDKKPTTPEEAAEKQRKEHDELMEEMSYMIVTLFYGESWADPKFPEAVERDKDRQIREDGKLAPTWLLIAAERAYRVLHGGVNNPATNKGAHITTTELVKEFWKIDSGNKDSFTQKRFGVKNEPKDIEEFRKAITTGVLDLDAQEFAARWNTMEWMRIGNKDEVIHSLQEHAKIRTMMFLREKKMMEIEIEDMYKVLKKNGIEYTGPPPEIGPDAPKPEAPKPAAPKK